MKNDGAFRFQKLDAYKVARESDPRPRTTSLC